MEQKAGKSSEDGATVPPAAEAPEPAGGGGSVEEEATGPAESTARAGLATAGQQEQAPAEDGVSAECHADGLGEVKAESQGEAELQQEDPGQGETTASPRKTDRKDQTDSEPAGAEGDGEIVSASEERSADEKEARLGSRETVDASGEAQAEPKQASGAQEAEAGGGEAEGPQEEGGKTEEPQAAAREEAGAPAAQPDSPKAAVEDEAKPEPQEEEVTERVEPGGPDEEQDQGAGAEADDGAGGPPSSPEGWPESPTEEGGSASPEGLSPDTAASEELGPSASDSSPSDVPQSPTEPPPSEEKKKEKAPERRVSAPTRPRGPRAQNRKAIVDKFGGAAAGPTALFRNTKAAGAAVGGVRNMLLEWCRAMTRSYEHVDIQNFSSSWGSGMAFCALIHKFFPDAFDYAALDPAQRRHNFTLAFSTAEKLADCAQLLEVDDMVRLAVPDSKCVYTYIQELYRSLVQKGLVKTKKK
ncbi:smoothelin-like protein 1 isoform X2 [Bubalus kerabau]|uniref:smoothelin-like protein 1 isoform X2 n=1 Tax=Bubalus carabanensis TaxID=3119969 RepID=UPI00244E7394|nr:smoothelin-like protein 1 isoform X2 [Bubalus carabanensis]